MNITLYASFPDAHLAEKAPAALLDRGAEQKDLSAPTIFGPMRTRLWSIRRLLA